MTPGKILPEGDYGNESCKSKENVSGCQFHDACKFWQYKILPHAGILSIP